MTNANFDVNRTNPSVKNLSVKISIDDQKVGLLDTQDIIECWFIEDIFSFNMYGKLVFYDNYGLVERAPLIGTELITLVYGVEELREVVFHIWKLKHITQVADTNPTDVSLIEVHFVDTSHYNMTVSKFSRSFEAGKRHTDVVKHILANMVGWQTNEMRIENSKTALTNPWVIPYWNASTAIKWLLKRAKGQDSGTSGYLCYNNTYQELSVNVHTLNWLFGSSNILDDTDYLFESTDEGQGNKIWEWWIQGVDHSTMDVVRGGKFRGFNPTTKELVKYDHTYLDGVSNTVLNGKRAIFSDMTDYDAAQIVYNEPTLDELKNVTYSDWIKKYSLQNLLNIIIQGNEKRFAGHQITIKWKSIDKIEQLWQKQLEGKYLIKSITHNFTGMGTSNINYMQRIVCIKNAYQDSDSKSLSTATKTNLTGGIRQRILLET